VKAGKVETRRKENRVLKKSDSSLAMLVDEDRKDRKDTGNESRARDNSVSESSNSRDGGDKWLDDEDEEVRVFLAPAALC
jgi:hypothetical protein